MAYYAFVKEERVTKVIVAEASFFVNRVETEPGEWIQTYTDGTRKHFAGKGSVYDKSKDAFYDPQPYASWTLNATTCIWEPPVACPSVSEGETKVYGWNEATTNWVDIT